MTKTKMVKIPESEYLELKSPKTRRKKVVNFEGCCTISGSTLNVLKNCTVNELLLCLQSIGYRIKQKQTIVNWLKRDYVKFTSKPYIIIAGTYNCLR